MQFKTEVNISMNVCVDVLCPSQQFFSLVGRFSYLPGLTKYLQKISVSLIFQHVGVFFSPPGLNQNKTEGKVSC